MKTYLRYATVLLLIAGGCRKEPLPQPGTLQQPMFFIECNAGGVPLRLEAGNDDYQMISGFHQDTNNVYVLTASIEKKNCQGCYSVKILLNDHMVSAPNGPLHIDSALRTGSYLFNDKSLQPTEYKIDLIPIDEQDPTGKYEWVISEDGQPDIVKAAYQCYLHAEALKEYTVTLLYEDATGCSTSHSTVLKPGAAPPAQITAAKTGSDLRFQFSAVTEGAPIAYHWEFGDGATSSEPAPVHQFEFSGGYYTATLTVTYADYRTSSATYQIAGSQDEVCMANFSCSFNPVPNLMALSKITLEITDASGKVYSTRDFVQPEKSRFEVVSIEDYVDNDQGQPTKRFRVNFDCLVKFRNEELNVTDGEAVLAIGYKE